MDVMTKAGLPVYVIQGQHDRSDPPWPLAIENGTIQYVHRKMFQPITNGPVFYGLDNYAVAAELQAELKNVPCEASTLVMHQLARAVFPLDGAWDFDTSWIPETVHRIFLADYHKKCEFKIDGQRSAYYTGSTYMCKIDEDPEKSVIEITLNNAKSNMILNFIQLRTRSYRFWVINDEKDLAAAIQLAELIVPRDINEMLPVVVINYLITVPDVEIKIRKALGDKAYLFSRPVSLRTVWAVADGKASDVQVKHATLEACAGTFLHVASEAYKLLMELLTNPNSEEVLSTWRTTKKVI